MVPDTSWAVKGACVDRKDVDWFPDERKSADVYEPARTICRACQVLRDCREYGLAHEPRYGVWGALSPEDRKRENRRRRTRARAVDRMFEEARETA